MITSSFERRKKMAQTTEHGKEEVPVIGQITVQLSCYTDVVMHSAVVFV